jgi:DNA-binding LacI/PurR family transcriptional regulator
VPRVEVAVPFQDNWYFDAVCDGIAGRLRAADPGLVVRVLTERPGREGRARVTDLLHVALADPDCVGAVAVHFEFKGEQVERLREHGKPVVVIGGRCAGLPSVFVDDEGVARLATEHLLSLGHVSITHLAGYALSPDDFTMRADRVRGYSEAMRIAGLDEHSQVKPCEFTHDAAYRAARELLSAEDRPTAVFAVADELALAVLDAAEDLGLRVPQDLSVIGVDDHRDAAARGLTTWRQSPEEAGGAAADRLLGAVDDDEQLLGSVLVRRATTAAPPAPAGPPARPSLVSRLLRRTR